MSGGPPLFSLRRPVARHRRRPPEPPPPAPRALRVGLLGGSFNPAHDGHRHLSQEALKCLRLDQVWWLVAPQNPLKPEGDMAPFALRLARAREVAAHPRIKVCDIEDRLGTRYSADTLARLRARLPHRFVFLMGADNLVQLPRWRRWTSLLELAPVAVFDRDDYIYAALVGRAATRFRSFRWRQADAGRLVLADPPAWVYLRLRPHAASSTAIREGRAAKGAVMGKETES